ncbi:hypothetical protein ACFOGI_05470 [Virgibacillus xinjiangensis]|uniref:Uncharacterized protein n=1 Tax=Virgibacillus xinjiangensis TaxID=393090 RepID=A0ABV7CTA7_9BACI
MHRIYCGEPIEWTTDEMAVVFTFWGEQAGMSDEPEPTLIFVEWQI